VPGMTAEVLVSPQQLKGTQTKQNVSAEATSVIADMNTRGGGQMVGALGPTGWARAMP